MTISRSCHIDRMGDISKAKPFLVPRSTLLAPRSPFSVFTSCNLGYARCV
ncbi:MAG: hypothetical protein J6V19_01990 [Alistipes sp.]|nr:hypothetical protein [Alistipes sp.]